LNSKLTRRDLAEKLAFGSFWAAASASLLGIVKLLMPAVMPDAATRTKLGHPEEFPPGTTRIFEDKNLFVFSDDDGIYAISAICTHLGCIVTPLPGGQFNCPCHGSKFNARGEAFAGPAPRGLDWIEIRRAPNGVLYADIASTVSPGTMWRRT
jgi:cytochrome b6-f complex iron-sulfur subunit